MTIRFDLSGETFAAGYLYQKPYLFKGAVGLAGISWQQINELYQRADPADYQFKFRKGPLIPKEAYVESFNDVGRIRHRFIKSAVYEYLRDGATLVYNRINNEPWVDDIAKQVAHFARAQTVVSGYLAFGDAPSYRNHWDTRDVFAVQLAGRKHWSLSAPNFPMPLYMQQAKDMPHIPMPESADMEVVLEAGDILYIPRGWWHNPVPLGCATFHLAIGTFPPNGYNYMEWLLKQTPEIEAVRHSFSGWEQDKGRLKTAAQELSALIDNPESYGRFMQEFLGSQRMDTAFNMEIFGNPDSDGLPDDALLRLNTFDGSTVRQGYLIANGIKTNLDEDSRRLLTLIDEKRQLSLSEALACFEPGQRDKVRQLVYRLAALDCIEVAL